MRARGGRSRSTSHARLPVLSSLTELLTGDAPISPRMTRLLPTTAGRLSMLSPVQFEALHTTPKWRHDHDNTRVRKNGLGSNDQYGLQTRPENHSSRVSTKTATALGVMLCPVSPKPLRVN